MHVPQTVIRLRVCYAERRELMLTTLWAHNVLVGYFRSLLVLAFEFAASRLTAPPTAWAREDVGHGVIRSAPNAPPRRQRERRTGTPRPVHREDGIHSSSEGPHLLPCSPFLKTTPHSLDSTHSSHQNLSSRSAEMGCAYATPRHKLAAYSIAPHVRLSRVREGNCREMSEVIS